MSSFEVQILGCGSATPTLNHHPTSQVLRIREKLFMVDCGEGTQLQMRKYKVNFNRLTHIFISHLHGDHCFGLIGLISTLDLLGRTGDVFIHADPALKGLLQPQIDFFASHLAFQVHFEDFNPRTSAVIYDDRSLKVTTIPLIHRISCAGFLFEEKQTAAHIIPEMIAFHQIPVKQIADIKAGADYVSPEGKTIPNKHLTRPSESPKRYAYCSDTAYNEKIIPLIEGVDLLFHESTFMEEDVLKAQKTFHSTAKQAATIAQMAKVKELMVGHYSARYNKVEPLLAEAKSIFPNTLLANEGIIKKL
jgi:ribonuclease Z